VRESQKLTGKPNEPSVHERDGGVGHSVGNTGDGPWSDVPAQPNARPVREPEQHGSDDEFSMRCRPFEDAKANPEKAD
jgi:hypothetical protein